MRGRPPDLHKRAKIVAAARAGLVKARTPAGIDAVARRAGVSKLTVYRHFGSYEALIRQVVHEQHVRFVDHADGIPRVSHDLRRTLAEIGERLLLFLTGEEGQTMLRVTSSPAGHRQGLGRLIYRDGPRTFVRRIARLLRAASRTEPFRFDAPLEAAEQLVGMWQGIVVTGLLMRGRPEPTRTEVRRRARRAVDAFLRAHARR